MNKMQKLADNSRRASALQAQFSGLISLHASALLSNDGKEEARLRQQIHDTVDAMLDNSSECINLCNERE